jgi:hypothetical protein
MARLGRLTSIGFLVFGVLVLAATSWAQTRSPIAEQIAKTYGLDSFGQVEAIRYTFNLKLPWGECLPFMGLGAQDRKSLLRGK